jgi:cytochrome c-type biogenesis protein CcmF
MNLGTLLLSLSLLSALGAILLYGLFFLWKEQILRYYAQVLTLSTFLFNSLAILLLTYYFLTTNLDFQYVWEYSTQDSPWYLKLSGVWAGQEGSFFFWTWLILLSIAIEVVFQMREDIRFEAEEKPVPVKQKKNARKSKMTGDLKERNADISRTYVFDWTIAISMAVVVVFMILIFVKNPFDPVDQNLLRGKPDGVGLNPLLRNLWMTTHPPLLFIGYALVTIPFAASMANMISDDRRWSRISLQWSRISWLFLTLGIGIGAVWAYVELAFGGYWAWDPVEVGSFIPWFTLTAFMHAQLMNQRKGEYNIFVSVLGMATFVLVIFATYITRSGVWDSVHAWQETTVGNILLGLMISTLILGSIIILRRFSMEEEKDLTYSLDFITMFATIILLSLIAIVMIIGLIVSKGTPNPVFYETRLFPFTFPLVIVLGTCLIWRYLDKENLIYTFGWIMLASIASVILLPKYVFPGTPEDFYGGLSSHRVIAFFVPSLLFAIGAAGYKIIRSFRIKSLRVALKVAAPHLIHLGMLLMIISYAFSMKMAEEATFVLEEGQTAKFGDYEFTLVKIEESTEAEKEIHDFSIEVSKNGKSLGTEHPKYVYYTDAELWRTEVAIEMRLTEDVYINILSVDPDNDNQIDSVQLKVRTIPLMAYLWTGMILMSVGIGIVIFFGYDSGAGGNEKDWPQAGSDSKKGLSDRKQSQPKSKTSSHAEESVSSDGAADDAKYQKMLEDELNNL